MPYYGWCLNVGRAGKQGARPEYSPVQLRQPCATSPGSTDSEQGQHAICAKPALIHEDLPGRAPASSPMVTTAACFGMTMSSSIAFTSASGSAQQSRTTTKR